MYFKIKELRLKVVYFHAALNQHKLTSCMHLPPLSAHIHAVNAPH